MADLNMAFELAFHFMYMPWNSHHSGAIARADVAAGATPIPVYIRPPLQKNGMVDSSSGAQRSFASCLPVGESPWVAPGGGAPFAGTRCGKLQCSY